MVTFSNCNRTLWASTNLLRFGLTKKLGDEQGDKVVKEIYDKAEYGRECQGKHKINFPFKYLFLIIILCDISQSHTEVYQIALPECSTEVLCKDSLQR